MKSIITAAGAALALAATAGPASAQHGGSHGGHHVAPVQHAVAPVHNGGYLPRGHAGHPAAGFGVGVSAGPVYGGGFSGYSGPVYGPVLVPAHGYRHAPHHWSHH